MIKKRVTELGVEFFDPYTTIENADQLYDDDKLLYSDMDHLSVYGAKWLYEHLAKQSIELLKD